MTESYHNLDQNKNVFTNNMLNQHNKNQTSRVIDKSALKISNQNSKSSKKKKGLDKHSISSEGTKLKISNKQVNVDLQEPDTAYYEPGQMTDDIDSPP